MDEMIETATARMLAELKRDIKQLKPDEYIQAKKLLVSLGNETRFMMVAQR